MVKAITISTGTSSRTIGLGKRKARKSVIV
jgi:hypothetical protein